MKRQKNPYAIFLRDIPEGSHNLAGGKAKNLALLLQRGFPVPDGYCIITKAFERFLDSVPSISDCFRRLESVSPDDIDRIREESELIRKILAQTVMPEDVEKAILSALSDMGEENSYAIRSSATAEDLDMASFAGQQDTYLNVKGREEIIKSVKRCWISMFTERAVSYRLHKNVDNKTALMAVVIQKMVDAEYAGVIFTVDPMTGNKERMVAEYAEGLGDALVLGCITPHNIIINKNNLTVLNSDKKSLDYDHKLFQKLFKTAVNIEKRFCKPQDIEWAVSKGKLYILQTRAITTLTEIKDQTVWSNVNVGEIAPHVATPLFYSYLQNIMKILFNPFLRLLNINLDRQPLIGLVAGRIYANLSVFSRLVNNIMPGPMKMDISEVFGGMPADISQLVTNQPKKLTWKRVNINLALIFAAPLLVIGFFIFGSKRIAQRLLKKVQGISKTRLADNYRDLSLKDLKSRVHWYKLWGKEVFVSTFIIGAGMGFTAAFLKICKKWLKDDQNKIGNQLLAGVGDLASANAGLELAKLALLAGKNEKVKGTVIRANNFEVMRRELKTFKEGKEFLDNWEGFMNLHGHHARGEVDIYVQRWYEQPDYILDMLKGYMDKPINDTHMQEKREIERKQFLESVLNQLRNPLKRIVFSYFLNKGRYGLSIRENFKNEVVRFMSITRKSVMEIEARWISQGILKERDDVFFITIDEFSAISSGKMIEGLDELILERRAEYQKNLDLAPPSIVVGAYDPDKKEELSGISDSDMRGIAVSAGIARGPARVILSCDCDEKVLPGEILVAPFTDPGWTPYFLNAAGIVMDMGGMLSHGSIVAREYGIPAVVNVGPATKCIKSGQIIEVDGDRGIVRVGL